MFGLIWLGGFRGEDLNVIFYQYLPNLHNQYKSTERNISHKNTGETTVPIANKLWWNGPWMAPFPICIL
jgi:hypothetical protein